MLADKGINRAGYGSKDVVYSRDNLLNKIKDEAYVINLDEYYDIRLIELLCMYWIIMLLSLIVLDLNTFQKKLKVLLVMKTYKQIFLGRYCYIGFIDFMLKKKSITNFTNFFCQMISKKMLI